MTLLPAHIAGMPVEESLIAAVPVAAALIGTALLRIRERLGR
jgi:hypothetical protein